METLRVHLKPVELFDYLKNLSHWFLQERDKLLRYRKQRKKMAKLPKVRRKCQCAVNVQWKFVTGVSNLPLQMNRK
jgi:hypothetical protein